MNDIELTLLTEGQVWGNENEEQLEVLKKYGTRSAISDLVILTGGYCEDDCIYMAPDDDTLKGRVGWTYTQSSDGYGDVRGVYENGSSYYNLRCKRNGAVRPALLSSSVLSQIYPNRVRGYNDTEEVEYGEYPQYAPDENTQRRLESEYQNRRLSLTGRNYTFDSTPYDNHSQGFQAVTYDEYEYNGKKYIRVKANSDYGRGNFKLSNGEQYRNGDYVWVEVSPVKWLIDDKTKILVSKIGLLSGIRFHTDKYEYNGDFKTTDMKEYLDKYMVNEIISSKTTLSLDDSCKCLNELYGYDFNEKDELDTIKELTKIRTPIIVHVIDTSDKIKLLKDEYFSNHTRMSLFGCTTKDFTTEMGIPKWYSELEQAAAVNKEEPFFLFIEDILSPSLETQKLMFRFAISRFLGNSYCPSNVKIIILDEYNRKEHSEDFLEDFAHVYFNKSIDKWLEKKSTYLHPVMLAYIASRKEKLVSDDRLLNKLSVASHALFRIKKLDVLKSLFGEEITKDFCDFCSSKVISLEQVLYSNYLPEYDLTKEEQYATLVSLSQVDEENIEIVRRFVRDNLGKDLVTIFDMMWAKGNKDRLELLEEIKNQEQVKKRTLLK